MKKRGYWVYSAAALCVVTVWVVMAGIGGPYFGRVDEVSSTDLATFLPESAESTKVNDELTKFRDSSSIPAIAVFEAPSGDLTSAQQSEITQAMQEIDRLEGVEDAVNAPLIVSEDGQAGFVVISLPSDGDFEETLPEINQVIDEANIGIDYNLTGPAALARDLNAAFAGIDGTLLFVALGVVFVILLLVYRSPILPIVTLTGAISALAVALFTVWHLASNDIVQLNGQVQGILFILVIGAATDYSLLYISRYREELTRHDSSWQATKAAWRGAVEPIIAAGGTVAVGLMCLLASDLGSNIALGPVGGIGVGFSVLAALTFLPAALLLFGRKAFWPRTPHVRNGKAASDYAKLHPLWARVGALVQRHPRRLWVGCMVLLGLACLAVPQLKAEGVSQQNMILGYSESREGQAMLDRHFPAGSGSPALVLVDASKQDEVVNVLDRQAVVSDVTVVTTSEAARNMPVGATATKLKDEIRSGIEAGRSAQIAELRTTIETQMAGAPQSAIDDAYQAAAANIPSADTLTEQAYPFKGLDEKVVDDKVMLQATLTHAPSSIEARNDIATLRQAIEQVDSGAMIGGTSAIQLDTNTASEHDLRVIIPLILLAITLILMVLLRAVVAPLVLLGTTVLSFGATIGIAALLFNHVWHFPGADPSVIIYGFVFLVALGIDYNIFLMTRVREETVKLGVNRGTIKALVVTGGVITSAGIVLAATFAALNVLPILFLAQIAFIVAFGVLLDTLIVRSLLVPSLTLEIGRPMWWPSSLAKKKQ